MAIEGEEDPEIARTKSFGAYHYGAALVGCSIEVIFSFLDAFVETLRRINPTEAALGAPLRSPCTTQGLKQALKKGHS